MMMMAASSATSSATSEPIEVRRKWSRKKHAAPTHVWYGEKPEDLPYKKLAELDPGIFASYSGPDVGIRLIYDAILRKQEKQRQQQSLGGNDTEKNGQQDGQKGENRNGLQNSNNIDGTCSENVKDVNNGVAVIENSGADHMGDHEGDTGQQEGGGEEEDKINDNTPEFLVEVDDGSCAGCLDWNNKSRKAYGICMSLYDQHPIKGSISGDPIADSFALCARRNNCLMVCADGVNWGEKSKLAARCAVYGGMKYVNHQLFYGEKTVRTTYDAFMLLLRSFEMAHKTILSLEGGLTTLCAALICPLQDSKQFAVCVVNVGDSLAYVFSKRHGVREITIGSHDITSERDIRDAGGALGPVNGKDPELRNLTCSMTIVDHRDIVFLTTDGISDNFDPVVTKLAVARQIETESEEVGEIRKAVRDGKPEMEPHERHRWAIKGMERIIHEFELFTEQSCSAQELCGALLQHVLKLTDSKRKVLENPNLFGRKMRSKERQKVDSEIVAAMAKAPGKLDHATVIAYEVGVYEGGLDEDDLSTEISDDDFSLLDEPRSPYLAAVAKPEEMPGEESDTEEEDDGGAHLLDVSPTFVIPVMCSYQYEERFKSFRYIDSDDSDNEEQQGRR